MLSSCPNSNPIYKLFYYPKEIFWKATLDMHKEVLL